MKTPAYAFLTLLLLLSFTGFNKLAAQAARVVEWVEDAPVSDTTKIALGYPVPVPVDTPLPFDGFRTYSGLHARHQDLAITTPWVHAIEIGETRAGRTIWASMPASGNPRKLPLASSNCWHWPKTTIT